MKKFFSVLLLTSISLHSMPKMRNPFRKRNKTEVTAASSTSSAAATDAQTETESDEENTPLADNHIDGSGTVSAQSVSHHSDYSESDEEKSEHKVEPASSNSSYASSHHTSQPVSKNSSPALSRSHSQNDLKEIEGEKPGSPRPATPYPSKKASQRSTSSESNEIIPQDKKHNTIPVIKPRELSSAWKKLITPTAVVVTVLGCLYTCSETSRSQEIEEIEA